MVMPAGNNFMQFSPFALQNFVFWVMWHADLVVAPAVPVVVPAGHAVHDTVPDVSVL